MTLSKTQGVACAATILAALALVLFVINVGLVLSNQKTQKQLNDRQQQINAGLQVSNLNQQLVRALGTASVANKDDRIKDLLRTNGITVSQDKPGASNTGPNPARADRMMERAMDRNAQ